MQGTIKRRIYQVALMLVYGWAVLSVIGLALVGQTPEEVAGWSVDCMTWSVGQRVQRRRLRRHVCHNKAWEAWRRWRRWGRWAGLTSYMMRSWQFVFFRCTILWVWRGGGGFGWLAPLIWWLWECIGIGWPRFGQQDIWLWVAKGLWGLQRLAMVECVWTTLSGRHWDETETWELSMGCVYCPEEKPSVTVIQQEDGSYKATLCGHFTLTVANDHPFRMRLLVLLLSLLDVPEGSRAVGGLAMDARHLYARCNWRKRLGCHNHLSAGGCETGTLGTGLTC